MTYFHGFAGPLFSPRHQPPPTSPCTRVLACRTFLNQKSEQISKVFSLPSLSNGAKLLPNFSCTLRAPRIREVIGYVRTPPRTLALGAKSLDPPPPLPSASFSPFLPTLSTLNSSRPFYPIKGHPQSPRSAGHRRLRASQERDGWQTGKSHCVTHFRTHFALRRSMRPMRARGGHCFQVMKGDSFLGSPPPPLSLHDSLSLSPFLFPVPFTLPF